MPPEHSGGARMSRGEREEWQIAVRDISRTYLQQQLALPGSRVELLSMTLEGEYPETELVIDLEDRRSRHNVRRLSRRYAIWQIPALHPRPGVSEPAESAAVMVATWALGG